MTELHDIAGGLRFPVFVMHDANAAVNVATQKSKCANEVILTTTHSAH